jgi:hypothetical protein
VPPEHVRQRAQDLVSQARGCLLAAASCIEESLATGEEITIEEQWEQARDLIESAVSDLTKIGFISDLHAPMPEPGMSG